MLRAPRRQRAVAAVAGRRRRRPRLAVDAVDVGDPGQSSDEEPGIVHPACSGNNSVTSKFPRKSLLCLAATRNRSALGPGSDGRC